MTICRHLLTMLLLAVAGGTGLVASESDQRPYLLCSTTQIADFARQVVGDRMRVESILGAGADPHAYEPGAEDAEAVQDATICFQNGLHLEGNNWMRRLAEDAGKPVVTCTDGIEPLRITEDGEEVDDPHAWFDPKRAVVYVRNIRDAVSRLDPEHADEYAARTALYLEQLRALDAWVGRQVAAIPAERRVLVTSHDAFNYFCDAYGFTSRAPVGWSTVDVSGTTATERQELVQAIRDEGVPALFVETTVSHEMLSEIAAEAGVAIGGELYSDAMGEEGSAGETYIGMMRENVLTIVAAFR